MEPQRPQPEHTYEAEPKFCRHCGEPSKVSAKESAGEPADKRDAAGGPPASHATSHIDGFFPTNPQPVEPLLETKAEARAKEEEESARQQQAADPLHEPDAAPRADGDHAPAPTADPLVAAATAYHRSVQTLSRAVIVVAVAMAFTVISLAIIHSASQHRMQSSSQASQAALVKDFMAANKDLEASRREERAAYAESAASFKDASEKLVREVKQRDEAREARQRAERKHFAEVLVARLPPRLTGGERNDLSAKLASIARKIPGGNAKQAVEEVRRSVISNEPRSVIYERYLESLTTLDERLQNKMEEGAGKTLRGE